VHWLTEPLQYSFMRTALAAAVLVGVTCAVLGVHVVQRRMAFIGDAMAHTTLPGLALAYLLGWNLSLGALGAGLMTALAIGWLSRRQMLKEDTAIGVVFTGMFALGLLFMSGARTYRDLTHILLGNLMGVTEDDLSWMAGVALIVFVTLFLFHKELELTAFDPTHAEVMGLKPDRMRYLLLGLLALAVVTAIQVVGVILTSALLVTPAAMAVLIADRFRRAIFLAAVIAAVSGVVGLYGSYYLDIGTGATIVVTCTALFSLTWIFRTLQQRFVPAENGKSA
jgi:ABC-type Mn2+/Zn2+ transport system permease subunit